MSYYILPLEIREMIALNNIEAFRGLQLVDKKYINLSVRIKLDILINLISQLQVL